MSLRLLPPKFMASWRKERMDPMGALSHFGGPLPHPRIPGAVPLGPNRATEQVERLHIGRPTARVLRPWASDSISPALLSAPVNWRWNIAAAIIRGCRREGLEASSIQYLAGIKFLPSVWLSPVGYLPDVPARVQLCLYSDRERSRCYCWAPAALGSARRVNQVQKHGLLPPREVQPC